IRVEVAVLPCDGRWRLYALAGDNLFRSTWATREVFTLSRVAPLTESSPSPSLLVRHDLLAEGWSAAVRDGWNDPALAGLLLVVFPAMSRLIRDALGQSDLVNPDHAFLRDDLAQAPARLIESLQQSLIDEYDL